MKCPKCKASIPEWNKACACGYKLDFSNMPPPPKQTGLINDYEAIIGDHLAKMIHLAGDIEKKTGVELVVVVISNTKPMPPENYAFYLFNKWNLGKKSHRAILMLVSMYERRIETEIGYGLEKYISEEDTEKLLDEIVLPYFKHGKYGEGLFEGLKALSKKLENIPPEAGRN